jgi:predicted phosphoribosyltransferase
MPLRDRADAGRQLAEKLKGYAGRADVVVIALPRGGVPVGYEVARALGAPLDVLVVRRLHRMADHDITFGAVAAGDVRVVDAELCAALGLSPEAVQELAAGERREVDRRQRLYRACRAELEVKGRTVILVDDGIATGASLRAAVAAVVAREPAAIVVAVPVASHAVCAEISKSVREVVYCFIRDPVYAVGLWYERYPPMSDEEACQLLQQANASA